MFIVTLNGKPATGKTTTIRKLIEQMLYDKATILWESHGISNESDLIKRCTQWGEIAVVLKYKGKVIGITSCGDYPQKIAAELAKILLYTAKPLDAFVCASHSAKQIKDILNVSMASRVIFSPSHWDFKPNEISYLSANANDVYTQYTNAVTGTKLIFVIPKKTAATSAMYDAQNLQSAEDMLDIIKNLL